MSSHSHYILNIDRNLLAHEYGVDLGPLDHNTGFLYRNGEVDGVH